MNSSTLTFCQGVEKFKPSRIAFKPSMLHNWKLLKFLYYFLLFNCYFKIKIEEYPIYFLSLFIRCIPTLRTQKTYLQENGWGKNVQGKGEGGGGQQENITFTVMTIFSNDFGFHIYDVLAFYFSLSINFKLKLMSILELHALFWSYGNVKWGLYS